VTGLEDLVILKSTGSEFHGFLEDPYTTLVPTSDRVMATSLIAKWRFTSLDVDWEATYAGIKIVLVRTFAEVKLSAPNKHHFLYDLGRFGLENDNEVFHADDRPYGLIQATVMRDDAPAAGPAWDAYSGLV
jgi:urate oxidase